MTSAFDLTQFINDFAFLRHIIFVIISLGLMGLAAKMTRHIMGFDNDVPAAVARSIQEGGTDAEITVVTEKYRCPYCYRVISLHAELCPHCGGPQK